MRYPTLINRAADILTYTERQIFDLLMFYANCLLSAYYCLKEAEYGVFQLFIGSLTVFMNVK